MKNIKVKNMTSPRGNDVPNQFIIWTEEGRYFQSYCSIIAFVPRSGKIRLGKDWDYSKTTGKYRNDFLNENKATTQAKLDDGTYILDPDL